MYIYIYIYIIYRFIDIYKYIQKKNTWETEI